MKNIKYGLIALAAVVVGTGSAYAVSASTETTTAISISAEPISIEDAAELTKTLHNEGCTYAACMGTCPVCRLNSGKIVGHCKKGGRYYHCTKGGYFTNSLIVTTVRV